MSTDPQRKIRLRLKLQPEIIMGPGKADVLRGIRDSGSISAAGRLYSMSYKRTWELVNRMNHDYKEPLVQTNTGGPHGGGAALTPMGEKVLALYEKLLDKTARTIAPELNQLTRLCQKQDKEPRPKGSE
jgi:molybdate transport system regulatory protein